MDYFGEELDDIEKDLARASRAVFRCYAIQVRERTPKGPGGLPFATGLLQKGLQLLNQTYSKGSATAQFDATAKSKSGFDYPTHLDLGGIHEGWWEKVNQEKTLSDCADRIMPRFDL